MTGVRTYTCDECGRSITVGPSGTEYGHRRGRAESGLEERCSKRPAEVDPWRRKRIVEGMG